MIAKDNWKTIMINAVRTLEIRGNLNLTEAAKLIGSACQEYKEPKPFNLFTAYLFQKANEEVDNL